MRDKLSKQKASSNDFTTLSDQELKDQISTHATLLRDAMSEQKRRADEVISAAEDEYITARDKLRSLTEFSTKDIPFWTPFHAKFTLRSF
tara:strand:+ start:181 stop:450 length:270 start_codon:yes stop_codon:yes gene_type:complete